MNLIFSRLFILFVSFSEYVNQLQIDIINDYMPYSRYNTTNAFCDFVATHNRNYTSGAELTSAFQNFYDNMEKIISHNATEYGYEIGVTKFADMNTDQFTLFKGHGCFQTQSKLSTHCTKFVPTSVDLPDSVDWRDSGIVTPIKDQKQCGSCWSFSATGATEGSWAQKTGELVSLSEQQLIDCSTSYGNQGCNGGLMDSAFEYIIDNGLCSESEIPYKASESDSCFVCGKSKVSMGSCIDVTPVNQLHLKEAVSKGPVAVAIEADASIFQLYKKGVISSKNCGTNLDHGVLIVGYGTEPNGTMYWLVKNSWGTGWGDEGYVKIARSESQFDKGICGIAMQPSYISI